jgi:hypothetical protein
MIKETLLVLLSLLVLSSTACVQEQYSDQRSDTDLPASTLSLTYYSGHFGSYQDCPQEAFNPDQGSSEPNSDGAPAEQADIACIDEEDCNEPAVFNCETAMAILKVTNSADEDLTGVVLDDLLILDSGGFERASLPVLAVTILNSGVPFDGTLGAGQSVELRVDFRGPLSVESLVAVEGASPQGTARLRLVLRAAGQSAATLDTPDIFTMPNVAT